MRVAACIAIAALTAIAAAHPGTGIVVNSKGEIFFVHGLRARVMKIDAAGKLSVFVQGEPMKKLSNPHHLVVQPDGSLVTVGDMDGLVVRIAPDGTQSSAMTLSEEAAKALMIGSGGDPFTIDSKGAITFISGEWHQTSVLKRLERGAEKPVDIAGSAWGHADGKKSEAKFAALHCGGFAWTPNGDLLVTDNGTCIRKITPDGTVTTIAGSSEAGNKDGPAAEARFNGVMGVAVDAKGRIIVADSGNRRIREITPDGQVRSLPMAWPCMTDATLLDPAGVAVAADGSILVLDYKGDNPRVLKLPAEGRVSVLATTE